MTEQSSILNNPYPADWAAYVQGRHWPVILPPTDQPAPGSFTPPLLFFSPIAGSLPVWRPDERRRQLDRVTGRLLRAGFPGSDMAVEYLRDKYTKNLTASTIEQAGRICLSFLTFFYTFVTPIFTR